MGVYNGAGKRKDVYGSFLIGVYENNKLHPICKMGTGFTN
jgi:ATP-dependent DNA ligase